MGFVAVVPSHDAGLIDCAGLPVAVAVAGEDGLLTIEEQRVVLSVEEAGPRCIGAIAGSEDGSKLVRNIADRMALATGLQRMPLLDLTTVEPHSRQSRTLEFIMEGMFPALERQLALAADLSRSLAALRQTHSEMQVAFSQLENFVLGNNLAKRTESLALLPAVEMAPLALNEGDLLSQRLPITTTGLSDIGLFIDRVNRTEDSALSITLMTVEDGAVRACWKLSGANLRTGPVRLAMRTALEANGLTPLLEIAWAGEGTLWLSTSLHHPDPRFQAQIDGRSGSSVLAVRCWSYIPGCEAPIPADAQLDLGSNERPPPCPRNKQRHAFASRRCEPGKNALTLYSGQGRSSRSPSTNRDFSYAAGRCHSGRCGDD